MTINSRLLFVGIAMVWVACGELETGSYVQVAYPCEHGAPIIDSLRVTWGLDDLAAERIEPGDEFEGTMEPGGGGGEVNVLVWIGGNQRVSTRMVGAYDDGQRYGVTITIDPFGSATVSHCRHPCPGSVRRRYEPWRGLIASMFRPRCR
jgi:hypothetical protein